MKRCCWTDVKGDAVFWRKETVVQKRTKTGRHSRQPVTLLLGRDLCNGPSVSWCDTMPVECTGMTGPKPCFILLYLSHPATCSFTAAFPAPSILSVVPGCQPFLRSSLLSGPSSIPLSHFVLASVGLTHSSTVHCGNTPASYGAIRV